MKPLEAPTLDTDAEYADAKAAHDAAEAEYAEALAAYRDLDGRSDDVKRAVMARMRAAEGAKSDATRALYGVTQDACERLRVHFEASADYKALVRTVIDDWAARLASALALVATVKQAELHGVSGLQAPPVLYAEIGQLANFFNAQMRRGVISARDFPDALGELPVALRSVVMS